MARRIVTIGLLLCIGLAAASWATKQAAAEPSSPDVARIANDLLTHNYRADAPGAAALVARGDTVLYRAARGMADLDTHAPLRPDSVFRIGSVTKQFAAAGLLTLVEAGNVGLDDRLSKYVPDFPRGDIITVRQLLNHTSGVKNYSALPGYVETTIRRDMTTAQIIDLFRNETPEFAPGSAWAYSNSGYVLVGAVIEAVSGQPWHAYLERALFKPLGLRHTGYGHDPRYAARQVRGYSYASAKPMPMRPMSMTQPHAAGSLVSNADDLFRWNRALHEGRVLKSDTYLQMITPAGKAADTGIACGFGLYVGTVRKTKALQHGGRIFGFTSFLTYLPGPDITVVVLENDDAPNGEETAQALARRLAAAALGDPYPAMRMVAVDAAVLRAAEGVYRFDANTVRVLRVVNGKLTAQRGSGSRKTLTPIADDDFLYADGFNRLKLERDAAGAVNRIRFFADGDGDGEIGVRTNEPLPNMQATPDLPQTALERLIGTYANGGLTLDVYVDGEELKAQIIGQSPVSLRALSPTRFEVEETGATLEFPAGDAPAAEVTIRQNGREIVLKRVR